MVIRRWLAALLLLALALPTPRADAQDEEVPADEEPETQPYIPPPPWKSVEVGNFYLKRKNYRAALSRFQEAASLDPHYAPAQLGLGQVYEKLGLRQKALAAYRKHLDLLPSTKDAEEAREVHAAIARLEAPRQKSPASRRGSRPAAPTPHRAEASPEQ